LVTGASGGLASLIVHSLVKRYKLVGIDPRAQTHHKKFPGQFFQLDYTSRKVAEIFRQEKFEILLHLGRVPLGSKAGDTKRYNTNVLGTRNLLELVAKYQVPRVVVCSTYHVYGAHPHNHLRMTENDPLRASQTFPELIDAVDMDNVSTNFLLKHPQIKTTVLRPVNAIGPGIRNRISMFLRSKFCPYLLGYDPAMQFIHETDLASAIKLAVDRGIPGVYNVAGEGVVSFTRAIRIAGSTAVPIPHLFAYPAASLASTLGANFPAHLVDYFRFPTILADDAFRESFGFEPKVLTRDALTSLRPVPPSTE
jgi:UDP-glucose 4-epimerase